MPGNHPGGIFPVKKEGKEDREARTVAHLRPRPGGGHEKCEQTRYLRLFGIPPPKRTLLR